MNVDVKNVTVGQIVVAFLVIVAVCMAAGLMIPFAPLPVGLLIALGLIFTKYVS